MGFPQSGAEDAVALCACHREVKSGGGFTCPCFKARICELPTQCHICGLTRVSSPHLARSYHHLFPVPTFEEVANMAVANGPESLSRSCYGCLHELLRPGGKVKGVRLACPRCRQHFCFDCDNTFMRVCIIAFAEILACRHFLRVTIYFNGSELLKGVMPPSTKVYHTN